MSQAIQGDYQLYEVIVVKQPEQNEDGEYVGKPELLITEGVPVRNMIFARDPQNAVIQAARGLPEGIDLDDVAILTRRLSS